MRYRIVERNGKFSIQARGYEIKGMLWWKKKVWDWHIVNIWIMKKV